MYQLISKYRGQIMGAASVMVVLLHFFVELYPDFHIPGVTFVLGRGNIGVDVFLLVSGMGLWFSMSKNADPIGFYKKRIQRVLLPTLAVTLPYWIWFDFFHQEKSVVQFLLDWTGLSFWTDGTTTIWYVSLILLCYLAYPLLFRLQKAHSLLILVPAGVMIGVCGAMFLTVPEPYGLYEIALTRVPIFLIGSFLGEFLQKKEQAAGYFKPVMNGYIVLSLAAFGGSLVLNSRAHDLSIMLYRFGSGGVAFLICFAVCLLFERFTLPKLSAGCKYLGAVSLELYLIHVMIRNIVAATPLRELTATWQRLLVIVVFIMVSVLVTMLVCKLKALIENSFQNSKKTAANKS